MRRATASVFSGRFTLVSLSSRELLLYAPPQPLLANHGALFPFGSGLRRPYECEDGEMGVGGGADTPSGCVGGVATSVSGSASVSDALLSSSSQESATTCFLGFALALGFALGGDEVDDVGLSDSLVMASVAFDVDAI
jgi:hypothetical protein